VRTAALLDPARLDYELVRRGMNTNDLAREAGLSAAYISHLRAGRARATAATVERLWGALERRAVVPSGSLLMDPGEVA
jgi:DNA-binding Xre family transcriptional regulator